MGFFDILRGRIRCPKCGEVLRHWRDVDREKQIADGNARTREMFSRQERKEVGFLGETHSERAFVCRSESGCLHRFDLDSALQWSEIASRLDEEAALDEYAKLLKEPDQR